MNSKTNEIGTEEILDASVRVQRGYSDGFVSREFGWSERIRWRNERASVVPVVGAIGGGF